MRNISLLSLGIVILVTLVLSSKQIILYNEEIIVAFCFVGFVVFVQTMFGATIKATFDERQHSLLSELQQYCRTQEAYLTEQMKHHEVRSNSLRSSTLMIGEACIQDMGTRCAPQCKTNVEAVLSQQFDQKFKAFVAIQDRAREQFQNQIVLSFRNTVYNQFRFAKIRDYQSKLVSQSISILKGRL
jgi:F0F1-type ATP synthase membrane subunit b/b'